MVHVGWASDGDDCDYFVPLQIWPKAHATFEYRSLHLPKAAVALLSLCGDMLRRGGSSVVALPETVLSLTRFPMSKASCSGCTSRPQLRFRNGSLTSQKSTSAAPPDGTSCLSKPASSGAGLKSSIPKLRKRARKASLLLLNSGTRKRP